MAKKAADQQSFCAGVDIKWFRDQPEAQLVVWRANQEKRFRPPELIDQIVAEDTLYRAALKRHADLKKDLSALSQQMKSKAVPAEEKVAIRGQCKALGARTAEANAERMELFPKRENLLCEVGVMVQDDVPVSRDEADSVVGPGDSVFRAPRSIQYDRRLRGSARGAGHRGFYLKGEAPCLNRTLIRYGWPSCSRGIHAPFLMRRAQLRDVQEVRHRGLVPELRGLPRARIWVEL